MAKKQNKIQIWLDGISDKTTLWIGSTTSITFHTIFFIGIFVLYLFKISFDAILLILTTLVSIEAIYLAIFIQRSVNKQAKKLKEVEESIEDVEESIEDVEESIEEDEKEDDIFDKKIEKQLKSILEEIQQHHIKK